MEPAAVWILVVVEDGIENGVDYKPRGKREHKAEQATREYAFSFADIFVPSPCSGRKVEYARPGKHDHGDRDSEPYQKHDHVLHELHHIAGLALGGHQRVTADSAGHEPRTRGVGCRERYSGEHDSNRHGA